MTAWDPSMPWPSGTPQGAQSPFWGGYVRLWIRAAISAGTPFHMGPHQYDRLDDGNTMGGAPVVPGGVDALPRAGDVLPAADTLAHLWIDLACDAIDVDIQGGASSSEGLLTKPDASTLVVNLADPDRKYDPLNPGGPYAYGGRSRLVPGTPVDAFAEVVDPADSSITREWLFSGTADSWGEDWTPQRTQRVAVLTATGTTKQLVKSKQPATVPSVGAGDTTAQRITRILAWAQWTGTVEAGTGVVTHGATALDADGWELLNATLDDELGFVYFTAEGTLRWVGRAAWTDRSPPVLELGCGDGLHDVLLDASPSALDMQIRNRIFAAREGGTVHTAISGASIDRYGRYDYERTDLGLETDTQAGEWAVALVQLYAFPQIGLEDVTFRPAIDPASWDLWAKALQVRFVTDLVRLVWAPPDRPQDAPIDTLARVVGYHHTITRRSWEVVWELVNAQAMAYAGLIFTLGPHARDRLDAAFVMG